MQKLAFKLHLVRFLSLLKSSQLHNNHPYSQISFNLQYDMRTIPRMFQSCLRTNQLNQNSLSDTLTEALEQVKPTEPTQFTKQTPVLALSPS